MSAFFGKGKKRCWETMRSNETFISAIGSLGDKEKVNADCFADMESYVCSLYGCKDLHSVNKARIRMFKSGKFSEELLPPNDDSLWKHTQRANYQAIIWKQSFSSDVENMTSLIMVGQKMQMVVSPLTGWTESRPWKHFLMECRVNAKSHATTMSCSCRKNGIRCTSLCKCDACSNEKANCESEEDNDSPLCSSDEEDIHFDIE